MNWWRRLLGKPKREIERDITRELSDAREQVDALKERADRVSERLRRESFLIAVEHTYRNRGDQR